MNQQKCVPCVRWTARLWSVASVLMISAFVFGGGENSGPWPTAVEWIGLALFPIGVVIGLAVAMWRELLGGLIGVASLLGFYVWDFAVAGSIASGPWFLLLAGPAFVFLLLGVVERRGDSALDHGAARAL